MKSRAILVILFCIVLVAPASANPLDGVSHWFRVATEDFQEFITWNAADRAALKAAHMEGWLVTAQVRYEQGDVEGMNSALMRAVKKKMELNNVEELVYTPKVSSLKNLTSSSSSQVLESLLAKTNQSDARYFGLSTALQAVKTNKGG